MRAIRKPDLRHLVPGADRSPPPAPIDGAVRIALLLPVAAGLGWGVPRALSVGSGLPLVAAFVVVATIAAWFLVGVAGDRASSRLALLAVPGPARLLLEAALFGLGAAAIWNGGSRAAAGTLLTVSALH